MFVFTNFLTAIASILDILLTLYMWVVIISALITWINPDPYNPIVRTLRSLTEPVFMWVRRNLPFVVVSGIDLSPLVVILGIQFLQMFLVNTLMQLAVGM